MRGGKINDETIGIDTLRFFPCFHICDAVFGQDVCILIELKFIEKACVPGIWLVLGDTRRPILAQEKLTLLSGKKDLAQK
jgi:hypothetical protein